MKGKSKNKWTGVRLTSAEITLKIEKWARRWENKGLSAKWISFICNFNDVHPGINYPLIKTHKVGNPARVIT